MKTPCTICGDPITGHGYCAKHYQRWKKYGDPLATKMPTRGMPMAERFWLGVDKSGECWIWQRKTTRTGYGQFQTTGRELVLAHRFAYEDQVGPIPDGLHLDHLCRTRNCVRPDHLEPVTKKVNSLRGQSPAALNAAKTECREGHPLSGANLMVRSNGARRCRECSRAYQRDYYLTAVARRAEASATATAEGPPSRA